MIFYICGVPTTKDGTEEWSKDSVSLYGYTLDPAVAKKVLDVLREHRDETRRTYVPGTIQAANDRAYIREQELRGIKQEKEVNKILSLVKTEEEKISEKLSNLIDF
jgi:hypothetical protein